MRHYIEALLHFLLKSLPKRNGLLYIRSSVGILYRALYHKLEIKLIKFNRPARNVYSIPPVSGPFAYYP